MMKGGSDLRGQILVSQGSSGCKPPLRNLSPLNLMWHCQTEPRSTPATPLGGGPVHPLSPLVRSGSVPGDSEDQDSLPPLRHRPPSLCGEEDTSAGLIRPPAISRSASDFMIRQTAPSRSALHLSLPVTSLMHFKKELSLVRRGARGGPNQRKSFIAATSPTLPRCQSPIGQNSPMESPRNMSPMQQFAFAPVKRGDGRRWSVASLPSSGYGTTPGSSNVSSQCSSQERLHQVGASHAGVITHCGGTVGGPTTVVTSASPAIDELRNSHHRRQFSSGDSNPSIDDDGRRSPMMRPRSRSLSSPIRSPVVDNDIILMNTLYKERFPKATQQMEERLESFIEDQRKMDEFGNADIPPDAVAISRFVHHQVMEMAKDCLQKSNEKHITSRYFYELSENLEKLLIETRDKSYEAATHLTHLIKKLLLIVSRPARLLECLEFDPEEFYHLLEQAEGQARFSQGIKTDIPQYIINKLGLNKDPLAELSDDLAADADTEDSFLNSSLSGVSNLANESVDSTDAAGLTSPEHSPSKSRNNSATSPPTPREEHYEMIKLISNGAYGAVYLVKHKTSKERFAMKKISKQNLMLRNQVEQVFNERDIMSFTDNPFVVSMVCSFETKRHLCLVMEYVEGGDCAALLKTMGPFPPDMARFYFAETVLAVEYLHSFGIVHRDLKPDNLLITAFGHIKLTDFGLSKMGLMSLATNLYEGYIDKETKQFSDKQVFGTPEYIAPEVILRQGYGKPVDWWAMGIILYELIIGVVPFFGETPEELFAHTVNDDIEWPDEDDWPVADDAKELITALLQHSPLDRLGTVGGAAEVKEHPFFDTVDWTSLLRLKAEFVPQLSDDEDTSYFDTRLDRYNHDMGADSEEGGETDSIGGSGTFGSFSSFSPRYQHRISVASLSSENSHPDTQSNDETPDLSVRRKRIPHSRERAAAVAPSTSRADSGHSDQSESSRSTLDSSTNTPDKEVSDFLNPLERKPRSNDVFGIPISHSTPESSQTESDDISPQIQRRRRPHSHSNSSIPRLSISGDDESFNVSNEASISSVSSIRELSPVDEKPGSSHLSCPRVSLPVSVPHLSTRNRSVIKSASASGLSLLIPTDDGSHPPLQSPGGSSTASSRDTSPTREISPLANTLKPPIIIRRGPRGYGFTIRAIRVYFGDTDFYTVHHLVSEVSEKGPACDAGLKTGDLITHINGEPIQGMFHTQVLTLIMSSPDHVTLRASPLDQTSIRPGGRKRSLNTSKLAKRVSNKNRNRRKDLVEKKRRTSLIRKISNKRVPADVQQLAMAGSPTILSPSRSFQSLARSASAQDANVAMQLCYKSPHSPPTSRLFSHPQGDLSTTPANTSSGSSSPSSPGSNSPSSATMHQRPSSLHVINPKSQNVKGYRSPNRRKSVGHVPVSPLARTPSPSPVPVSPTRSPSPLVPPHHHHHHHCPGSSNTTQSYTPGAALTPTSTKKCINRPKSAEPGSPLLRRALSPDRLHPRYAENKAPPTISPLATPPKTGSSAPRVTITTQTSCQRYTTGICSTSSVSAPTTVVEAPEEVDSPVKAEEQSIRAPDRGSKSGEAASASVKCSACVAKPVKFSPIPSSTATLTQCPKPSVPGSRKESAPGSKKESVSGPRKESIPGSRNESGAEFKKRPDVEAKCSSSRAQEKRDLYKSTKDTKDLDHSS